jgi:peptide/nickel transport system substrate-binding protein
MATRFDMTRQRRISRRSVLRGGAMGMGALAGAFLLACGGDDDNDESSGSTGGSPAPDTTTVKQGGTVRIGQQADFTVTEPHRLGTGSLVWNLYDQLIYLDKQFNPVASLAEKWEQTPDKLQITLKIRQGVTYHSGRPFTAEDVKWNIERVQNPSAPFAQYRAIASHFNVQITDPQTVVIKTAKPLSVLFDYFDIFMMADKDTVADPVKMVGTGAWKLGEFKQGSVWKMDKNPNFWGKKVNLDSIQFNVALGTPEAAIAQLESGAIDAIYLPSLTGFARFKSDPNYQAIAHGGTGAYYLNGFNMTKTPFGDKRVRQAFSWATDRQRFVDLVLKGVHQNASLPWPKASIAYDDKKNKFYEKLDLKKAADLFRAAGVTSLKTQALTLVNQEYADFIQLWQNDLKGLGVTLEAQPLQGAAFIDSNDNLKYDAVYVAGAGGAGIGQPVTLFVTATNIFSGDGKNNVGFKHDRWSELTDLLIVETDVNKQKTLYSEVNDIFLDEVPQSFTATRAPLIVAHKKVKGIDWRPHDSFDFYNTWLDA